MANVQKTADRQPTQQRTASPTLGIAIVGCMLAGVYSILCGQDNGYDLRYYHYYDPYALFAHRIGFDYGPAQIQSYLNPLSFVPFYLLANHAPAMLAGFLLGAAHGLLFGLVFAVAKELFDLAGATSVTRTALLCAALGLYGPIFGGLAGTSANDFLIAQLVLVAILLVLRWWRSGGLEAEHRWRAVLASGAILGAAFGLKMTAAIYAVAAAASLVALPMPWRARVRLGCAYAAAVAVGFVATAGWWMIVLQTRFGSPTFPFFNAVFKSPDYPATNFADRRSLPQGVTDALIHPLRIMTGSHREGGYRDARYLVLFALVAAMAVTSAVRWVRRRTRRDRALPQAAEIAAGDAALQGRAAERFLLLFVIIAYIMWQWQFAIVRYASPLEALVPLACIVLVHRIATKPRHRGLAAAAITIVIVAATSPFDTERMPWSRYYIHAEAPRFANPSRILVVIAHNAPWGFVLPALQPEIRVLGLRSNLTKPADETRFQAEMRQILARHTGDIYLLSDSGYLKDDAEVVRAYYDLVPTGKPCERILTPHQSIPIYLCPLQKATP